VDIENSPKFDPCARSRAPIGGLPTADAMLPELVSNGYIGIHGETSAKIGRVNVDFQPAEYYSAAFVSRGRSVNVAGFSSATRLIQMVARRGERTGWKVRTLLTFRRTA
jgi:hypothetical protein